MQTSIRVQGFICTGACKSYVRVPSSACGLGNPGLSSIQGGNWLDCVPLMAYRVQGSRPVVNFNPYSL
jgi:hypothetical protein